MLKGVKYINRLSKDVYIYINIDKYKRSSKTKIK